MTSREALEVINKYYLPGCVDYYEKQNPDPWMQAHEDWSNALLSTKDWDMQSQFNKVYAKKICNLIADYQNKAGTITRNNFKDAFNMGDPDRLSKHLSRDFHCCYKCDEDSGIRIALDEDSKPYVVCEGCEPKKQRRQA